MIFVVNLIGFTFKLIYFAAELEV